MVIFTRSPRYVSILSVSKSCSHTGQQLQLIAVRLLVAPNSQCQQVSVQEESLKVAVVTLSVALFATVLPPAEAFIVYLFHGVRIQSGAMLRSPVMSKQQIRQALQ